MTDWTKSMTRTFEYYTVDPGTWCDVKRLTTVKSCSITRDITTETLGSASIDADELIDECYVRVYLITIQNGVRDKYPLGTYLVQTPSQTYDGRVMSGSIDAYTSLIELKEKQPPLGYSILKGANIMENAYLICRENMRAPVVKVDSDTTLYSDFVSNTDDTWTTFISDLVANDNYELDLDERGRLLFAPKQDISSLQPVWTYTDDNSSILQPEISLDRDLYGIPNVVEVIYSDANEYYTVRVVNDDPNSATSTVARGREIPYRDTSPSILGDPSEKQIEQYAQQLLKSLSSVEYTLKYKHGYCPVRVRDCVRLNYKRSGIYGVKAKVQSQSISCDSECQVTETAVFTVNYWG